MKRMAFFLSVLFVLLTSSYAFAATNMACNYDFSQKGTFQGISYLSGGVGQEERDCLAPMEKNYNLMMVFALNSKPFLANESVTIQNQQGKDIFQGKADGPWLLVKLPSGDYKVMVSRGGHKSEIRHVKVGDAMHVERFLWKS